MNKTLLTIMTGAALSFAVQQAEATQITGTLGFSGDYHPDNANLTLAHSITFNPGDVFVGLSPSSATGSFTGLNGAAVTMASPIAINPTSSPIANLWQVGGFSFDALTFTQSGLTASTITLTGTGTLKNALFDNTPGTFLATFNTAGGGAFTFSASNAAVPDGGATAMLLGAGFLGLAGLRRKLS